MSSFLQKFYHWKHQVTENYAKYKCAEKTFGDDDTVKEQDGE